MVSLPCLCLAGSRAAAPCPHPPFHSGLETPQDSAGEKTSWRHLGWCARSSTSDSCEEQAQMGDMRWAEAEVEREDAMQRGVVSPTRHPESAPSCPNSPLKAVQ